MKVRLLGQQFINILPTIVAIWFALWPQRARDAPPAISSIYICVAPPFLQMQMLGDTMCWIPGDSVKRGESGGSGLLPTTENKKIRVNSPSVCECLVLFLRPEKPSHSGVQQKKRLHNSFHLVQGINQANNKRQTGWRHLPSSCC